MDDTADTAIRIENNTLITKVADRGTATGVQITEKEIQIDESMKIYEQGNSTHVSRNEGNNSVITIHFPVNPEKQDAFEKKKAERAFSQLCNKLKIHNLNERTCQTPLSWLPKLQLKANNIYVELEFSELNDIGVETGTKAIELDLLYQKIGEEKKLLILGHGGSGKSTLCQKIAYDLSNQQLKDVAVVLLFNIRDMTPTSCSLEQKLLSICSKFLKSFDPSVVKRVIQDHAFKMLIILDGLDEVSDELKKGMFNSFFFSDFSTSRLILTSRPTDDESHFSMFKSKFNIKGLTENRIEDLVLKYFKYFKSSKSEPDILVMGDTVLEFVKQKLALKGEISPLLLFLVCFCCDNSTYTIKNYIEIFKHLIMILGKKSAERIGLNMEEEEIETVFARLGEFLNSGEGFEPEYKESDLSNRLGERDTMFVLNCNIFTKLNTFRPTDPNNYYQFSHKIFYDYLQTTYKQISIWKRLE